MTLCQLGIRKLQVKSTSSVDSRMNRLAASPQVPTLGQKLSSTKTLSGRPLIASVTERKPQILYSLCSKIAAALTCKSSLTRSGRAPELVGSFASPLEECHLSSIWVARWVDYSSKYGLGYQLTDGTIGVFFNDLTSLVLSSRDEYGFFSAKSPVDGITAL